VKKILNKNYKLITLGAFLLFLACAFLVITPNNVKLTDTSNIVKIDEQILTADEDTFLIYGKCYGPGELDPHNAWDTGSFDVIDQVVETLLAYNLSDPELSIIPRLASSMGTWSPDNLNYMITLGSGVMFHDGTIFNATAVRWSFDRLAYFMNVSGTLPEETRICLIDELYRWNDGTPIINRTEIINANTINFVLNRPFGAFEALLCFTGSGIMSPNSTPTTEYIDFATGDLIGTGPFVYDEYIPNIELNFHAFENYWAGVANITYLKFSIITDANERNQALLSGEIDILDEPLPSFLDIFEIDPNIIVKSSPSTIMRYLGMNNKQINKTKRQAISYAINYSYIIDVILDSPAARLKSPIPNGIRYANDSFNVATLNLTKARNLMQGMGFGIGFNISDDAEWITVAEGLTPFETYNYTYNIGNRVREEIFVLLQDNLKKIGIEVTDAGMSLPYFLFRCFEFGGFHRDMLQLYFFSWMPDYNDPSNYINTMMTNRTVAGNGCQINDYYLQDLMEKGLQETNPVIRKGIYEEIQRYCVEDLMPWAFGYVAFNYAVYNINITRYQPNPMGKVWFYGVSGGRLEPFIDNIDPIIEITYSNLNTTYGNGSIYIEANVTDDVQLQLPVYVGFYYPNGTLLSMENMIWAGGDTYNFNWSVNSYPADRYYYFTIYANDTSNNMAFKTRYFSIIGPIQDTTNPVITITYYDEEAEYGTDNILVTANIIDNIMIQEPVVIKFYNPNGTLLSMDNMRWIGGYTYYFNWSVNFYPVDSLYYFTIYANDTSNNTAFESRYFNISSFIQDTINPVITITYYDEEAEYGTGNILVTANIIDNIMIQEPVVIKFYNPNGTLLSMDNMIWAGGDTYDFNWSVNSYPIDNLYYFTIYAYDNSSNMASETRYFNISEIIPSPTFWVLSPFIINDDGTGDYTWMEVANEEWCSGSGTWNDPYIIKNLIINGNGESSCIEIKNSNVYFQIENCTVYNSWGGSWPNFGAGIKLNNVSNAELINNNCSFNRAAQIFLDDHCVNNTILGNLIDNFDPTINYPYGIILRNQCNNNTISENTISKNHFGIYLGPHCSYNIISGNTIINGNWGIEAFRCVNNIIFENTIIHNNFFGIILSNCSYFTILDNNASHNKIGIFLEVSEYCIVLNNIINDNSENGIGLQFNSNNNIFSGNILNCNSNCGVKILYDCHNNTIFDNLFINNGQNAQDSGINNQWDNGTIGNYWDDYDGIDANDDGIGDTPYNIPGTAGSVDNFPIWDDGIDIIIPSEILEDLITILENLEVPEEAECDINIAIRRLNRAIIKFEKGKFYDAFNKIQEAVEHLMYAQDLGADTQEIIDSLINLVQGIVDQALEDAINMVGEDNYHIIVAQEKYNLALQKLANGKYDKAVRYFKRAYKNAMKARCEWIPESYLDDLLDRLAEIQELKTGDISDDAMAILNNAESKLIIAIEKANASNLKGSFYRLEDVIYFLLEAEGYGVNTSDIIESIVNNIKDVVYLKIVDAESALMNAISNPIENAWNHYNEAQELWNEGNYGNAINHYVIAIEKVKDALLP